MAKSLGAEANRGRTSPPTVIAYAVTGRRPKTRYAVGFGAKPLIGLRRLLPDRAFDTVIARAEGYPAEPQRATARRLPRSASRMAQAEVPPGVSDHVGGIDDRGVLPS